MTFDEAVEIVLRHEGGYADHPADPGGKTRFGITEAVARQNGYRGDMRDFPLDLAKAIYRKQYWDACSCDALPPAIRLHVFDYAVNSGTGRAIKDLQRVIGTMPDGVIGPKTLMAAGSMPTHKIVAGLCGTRLTFLANLGTWGAFGAGWTRRVASNLLEAAK